MKIDPTVSFWRIAALKVDLVARAACQECTAILSVDERLRKSLRQNRPPTTSREGATTLQALYGFGA